MNKNLIGALLVSLAANVVIAEDKPAAATSDAKIEYVCQNNTCKGKAECMGFGNDSCKGHNECKSKGTLKAKSKAACEKKDAGRWVVKK